MDHKTQALYAVFLGDFCFERLFALQNSSCSSEAFYDKSAFMTLRDWLIFRKLMQEIVNIH